MDSLANLFAMHPQKAECFTRLVVNIEMEEGGTVGKEERREEFRSKDCVLHEQHNRTVPALSTK